MFENVALPVTAIVFENVALPVTAIVFENVTAPVALKVFENVTAPVALKVFEKVTAPVALNVLANVTAPLTVAVPRTRKEPTFANPSGDSMLPLVDIMIRWGVSVCPVSDVPAVKLILAPPYVVAS